MIVSKVYQGGSAQRAGIQKGDVILAVDDQPVEDLESFRYRVATRTLGSEAKITVWRGQRPWTLKMRMAPAPENPPAQETEVQGRNPLKGATVANLSPALAEKMDLEGLWEGVIITSIQRSGPAYRVGFRPGDIILAINGTEVSKVAQIAAALVAADNKWAISYSRDGKARTVEIGR